MTASGGNEIRVAEQAGVEILIAEDSRTQAEQLQHLLESSGYTVMVTRNGKEALEAARARKPSLVVSDVVMPEMDGYTLCQNLKASAGLKDVPVMLLTSLNSPQDVIRGLACGADNFLRKPYDGKNLLSRVQYILTTRELRREARTEFGVRVWFGGREHFINSDRQQILDLLISTYEEAVRINQELESRQKELARSYEFVQSLYRLAADLNESVGEKAVAEKTLSRALEFPGIEAGWICFLDGEQRLRVAATRGVPESFAAELARVLADVPTDVIYTTQFIRTRETAAPLARARGIEAIVVTAGKTYAADLAKTIREKHAGQTVLVVGHSNSTPSLLRELGVEDPPRIDETRYDDLFICTISGNQVRLVPLRYGLPAR